jgi:hypothetical protein
MNEIVWVVVAIVVFIAFLYPITILAAIVTFFLSLRGLVMWLIGGDELWWVLGFILTFILVIIANIAKEFIHD